jgi:hypothetical protein
MREENEKKRGILKDLHTDGAKDWNIKRLIWLANHLVSTQDTHLEEQVTDWWNNFFLKEKTEAALSEELSQLMKELEETLEPIDTEIFINREYYPLPVSIIQKAANISNAVPWEFERYQTKLAENANSVQELINICSSDNSYLLVKFFRTKLLEDPNRLVRLQKYYDACQRKGRVLGSLKEKFDSLSTEAQILAVYFKSNDTSYLNFIINHIPVLHLSPLFQELININDGNNLFTNEKLKSEKSHLYTAYNDSKNLRNDHHRRIAVAFVLAIVLLPSLFFTIPWIIKKKRETLLERREVSTVDYENIKQLRQGYFPKSENNQSILFNAQGELKADKNESPGKVTLTMLSEQAKRFDCWLKIKKEGKVLSHEQASFFRNSKQTSEANISNCKHNTHTFTVDL